MQFAGCNLTVLCAVPEHCVLDPAGSKKAVGPSVGLPQCHQPAHKMKGPSCTNSLVGAQQCKTASKSTPDLQHGFPEKAESHFGMQPASVSAIHGYAYQATLQQPLSMPSSKQQSNKQATESASIGRSGSAWSSFLDSGDATPDACRSHRNDDGDVLSDDGDTSDLVTALD